MRSHNEPFWLSEVGSDVAQSAGVALMAVILIGALLNAGRVLAPAVDHVFSCLSTVLLSGTVNCGTHSVVATASDHIQPNIAPGAKTDQQVPPPKPILASMPKLTPTPTPEPTLAPTPEPTPEPTRPKPNEPPLPNGTRTADNDYGREHEDTCVGEENPPAGQPTRYLCSDDPKVVDELREELDSAEKCTLEDSNCEQPNKVDEYYSAQDRYTADLKKWEAEQQEQAYKVLLAKCRARGEKDANDRCTTTIVNNDGSTVTCQMTGKTDPINGVGDNPLNEYRCGTAQDWKAWDEVIDCNVTQDSEMPNVEDKMTKAECDLLAKAAKPFIAQLFDGELKGGEKVLGDILSVLIPPVGIVQGAGELDRAIKDGNADAILSAATGIILDAVPLPGPGKGASIATKAGRISAEQLDQLRSLPPGTATTIRNEKGELVPVRINGDKVEILGDAASLKDRVAKGESPVDLVKQGVPLADLKKADIKLSNDDLIKLADELPEGPQFDAVAREIRDRAKDCGAHAPRRGVGLAAPLLTPGCFSQLPKKWRDHNDHLIGLSNGVPNGVVYTGTPNTTMMQTIVTPDMIKDYQAGLLGSSANNRITPPGWPANNRDPNGGYTFNRAHLLANSLGGSGDEAKNLVTMHAVPNQQYMGKVEQWVSDQAKAGHTLNYGVDVRYSNGPNTPPTSVRIVAESTTPNGPKLDVTIENSSTGAGSVVNQTSDGFQW